LNLALSSAKNVEKIDSGDKIFYRVKTKDTTFPFFIIHIQENLAYASNDYQRLKQAYTAEGNGPEFLSTASIEGIPEDTILFAELKKPKIRALLYGQQNLYRLIVDGSPAVSTLPPALRNSENDIVRIETNGSELVGAPAATYLLQSHGGQPLSALLLNFRSPSQAQAFEQQVMSKFNPEFPEMFTVDDAQCLRHASDSRFLCRSGVSVLLSEGDFSPHTAEFKQKHSQKSMPFILNIDFKKDPIREFRLRAQNKDWSQFAKSSPFYFLSCVTNISGGINADSHEIAIEIE
jgi:hypothetical protein